MKFLVIGGSGFIGSHLVGFLKSKEVQVIGTRNNSLNKDLIKFDLKKDNFLDLLKNTYNDEINDLNIVICYKYGLMDQYVLEKEQSYTLEVTKIIEIIKEAKKLGIKIVYLSTSYIFDGDNGYYKEDDKPNPVSEYGFQKLLVDKFISSNLENYLILRLDKIVGDKPEEDHLFKEWKICLNNKKPIICIKDQILSPTYVTDVVKGIFRACEYNLTGVFHHANPQKFRRNELAGLFCSIFKNNIGIKEKELQEFGMLERRPQDSSLNVKKFINATSFKYTSMQSIIKNFKGNVNKSENLDL